MNWTGQIKDGRTSPAGLNHESAADGAVALARAHELFDGDRHIQAGRVLQAAVAAGAKGRDGHEQRWCRRCLCDAAAAEQLRDSLVGSKARTCASNAWLLSTDAEGIAVLYRAEQGEMIFRLACRADNPDHIHSGDVVVCKSTSQAR